MQETMLNRVVGEKRIKNKFPTIVFKKFMTELNF